MFNLIDELFNSYGLIGTEVSNGRLYSFNDSSMRTAFWLVTQENDLRSILGKQSNLFDTCSKVCQKPALDKNIYMLVLWNTGGNKDLGEMKNSIMSVEEDPYYFKKNVLYFSDTELESLKNVMGVQSIAVFLRKQIVLPEIFAEYRSRSIEQIWQSLLYRIAIKIPFVEIKAEKTEDMDLLFKSNRVELENAGLLEFEESFFNILNNCDTSKLEPKEFLEKLLPTLGGVDNGD